MPRLTYLGHPAFTFEGAGGRVVIDPFLTGNPLAAARPEEIFAYDLYSAGGASFSLFFPIAIFA